MCTPVPVLLSNGPLSSLSCQADRSVIRYAKLVLGRT
jgi:hypothetical protein